MRRAIALILGLWSPVSLAQQVTVNIDPQLAEQYGIDVAGLDDEMSGAITNDLNLGDQSNYLRSMARAAAISTKGMGVDYGSAPDAFILGGSLGTGVNAAGVQLGRGKQDLPEAGFSFQVAGMAGLNLGAFNHDGFLNRFVLSANGMALNTRGDVFDGKLENFGVYLQCRLIEPMGVGLSWGGLALTSGYALTNYSMKLKSGLPVTAPVADLDVTWNATGAYEIASNTTAIPIELSTSLQVLLFTLYGGVGMDINTAAATSEISLGGDLVAEVPSAGQQQLGSALVSLSDVGKDTGEVPRIFLGLQANLLMLKLYGHLNVAFDQSFGGHFGVRLAR